jgi:poly-gamma-glutamate synthesis protein (capsule biosynthesis protein)
MDGEAVGEASVSTSNGQTTTDGDGWFQIPQQQSSQWVTVEHPNFISRTRAAAPGSPVLVRLTPDDGETVSLHFAGDTMFGRRFYDPNEDGDTRDGLLQPGDGVDEHSALLDDVKPLLENADLSVVNLETPLANEPYVDPTKPRPDAFHPTKDFAFASDPSSAAALKAAGVDLVDLGNNHLYDRLEEGVSSTLGTLDETDVAHFVGGLSTRKAWEPAAVTVDGQKIAFLGCTTIVSPSESGSGESEAGSEADPLSYVASGESKGGAAECDEETIKDRVADARAKYDVVVMMIHGGYEYGRIPSNNIKQLTTAARESGAMLIINHHPHVVGGFEWDDSSLTAWTLGNFLFDQTVWPTFESYLLTVDVRHGRVVRAYVEPLMIEGYKPKGLTGELADYVARGAAGRERGPFQVEDGAMEVDVSGAAERQDVSASLDGGSGLGTTFRMGEGSWVSDFSGAGDIQLGRDLLWTGSFEDEDVDAQTRGGALWKLESEYVKVGPQYAYEGNAGARIERESQQSTDGLLTPLHRIPVESGKKLSVVGMVRRGTNADVSMKLGWYSGTKGPSATQTSVPLDAGSEDEWVPFRVDVTVPKNAVAMGLYLRLKPPSSDQVPITKADFDNIRIVEWAPAETSFGPLYDYARVIGSGEATVSKALLPGAEEWSTVSDPKALPAGEVVTPEVVGLSAPGRTEEDEEE